MGQRLGNGIAQFLSDVLVVGCMHISLCIGFCLRVGGRTASRNMERIRR